MVVVQLSFNAKSALGLMVKMVGPPLTAVSATLRVPLLVQTIWNQLPLTVTGSLKVTWIFVAIATPVAPLAGTVLLTVGAASDGGVHAELEFCGLLLPSLYKKSLALLSVSVVLTPAALRS